MPMASIYQRFEPVKTVEVQMTMNGSGPLYNVKHDSGFKMISFRNGNATDIIQGLNQPNVGIFTFNTVNYSGWQHFSTQTIDSAMHIVDFNPNYQVRSFNVLFIDEFYFEENAYKPDELFMRGSKNLPEGIFDSSVIDYNLVMQKEKDKKYYQEEMSIKVFDEIGKKTIRIIGNITFKIDPVPFSLLLKMPELRSHLDFVHNENKANLIDILKPEISTLIGLRS